MNLLLAACLLAAPEPTVAQILERYDAIMGPKTFESESEMTAHREDGTSRTYVMKILKGEGDQSRIWFTAPAAVKGQEMLRNGDNIWLYLTDMKRAMRVANRDSFQGGDFNNADILRTNYQKDYSGKLVPSDKPETYLLELKATNDETGYDAIKLWVRVKDLMPVHGEYYATSGDLLRSADFLKYTQFDKGYARPAQVLMRNEQVKARSSELVTRRMKINLDIPSQRFSFADLGR